MGATAAQNQFGSAACTLYRDLPLHKDTANGRAAAGEPTLSFKVGEVW